MGDITVSSAGPTQTILLKGSQRLTQQLEKRQEAIGTGRKHNSHGELGKSADVFSAAEFRQSEAQGERYKALLTTPLLNASVTLAGTLRRLAEQGHKMATSAEQEGLPNYDIPKQATILLNQATDLMNTKIGGLSITSGSASDKTAWDKTALQDPDTYVLGPADDKAIPDGYQGDDNRITFSLNGMTHEITLSGNELGPQRIVRAYQLLATPDTDANYAAKIKESVRLFAQAKSDMLNIQARLGIVDAHVEEGLSTARQKEFDQAGAMQEINGTNNIEEVPMIAVLAVHLQTIFSTIAKDTKLTEELLAMSSN